MAITNLGTLRTAVQSWLAGRTLDSSLFAEFANEVTGFLHTGMRDPTDRFWIVPPLRSRLMETTGTLTVSSASAAVPADWLESKRLWIDTQSGDPLRYVSLQEFRADWRTNQTGEPEIYTIDDTNFKFAPTSDATVQHTYFQTLGALAADADTNVVLTAHPQVYRRGCLWMALDWQGPDDDGPNRSQQELGAFGAVVTGLNAQAKNAQHRGSLLVMRPVRATP